MLATTDGHLLEQWGKAGDAEAFRALVGRHARMVYATARRILGDPSSAEDVVQDCFLKLVEAPVETSNLPGWLHRAATNRSLDKLRAEKRRHEREVRWARPTPPSEPASWAEIEGLVDDAIDSLPEELRDAVVLHFLESRTCEDIGATQGVSKAAVSYRVAKGIAAIRQFLKRRGIEAAPALLAGWLASGTARAEPPSSLFASLGKMAMAGPRFRWAAPSGESAESAARRALPIRRGLASTAATILMELPMKSSTLIATGVLVVAACGFLILRSPGKDGQRHPEAVSPPSTAQATAPSPKGSPPLAQAEAPASPKEPAAVEDEKPVREISGTVLDDANAPIPGAEVILASHPPGPKRDLPGEGRLKDDWLRKSRTIVAVTDTDGAFRFEGVDWMDPATVSAFREGFVGAQREIELSADKPVDPVTLKLSAGKTLRGVVLGRDGKAVTDAVVSVYHAWHPKDMAWGSSLAATDIRGRFAIGLSPKAELCDIRVNSESLGQDFFLEIPMGPDEVVLRMQETASLRGTITWVDGSPARDVFVRLRTEVPEPRIPIWYSGWRPALTLEAPLEQDGSYEVHGLYPGLEYEATVVQGGPDRLKAALEPLTPRGKNTFTLSPAEVKTWDASISRPIWIHGTVRTERKKTPLQGARIGIKKDGKAIQERFGETSADGVFKVLINAGPGSYLVYAKPPLAEEDAADPIAERFGRAVDLAVGDDTEVDLEVFEPLVVPIRVLDSLRKPVESIRYELSFKATNGRRFGQGSSTSLDKDGRISFALHFPVEELTLQVSAFPAGPLSEAHNLEGEPGTVLAEETFVLERTCDLSGILVDGDGKPVAESRITIEPSYEDGKSDRLGASTDKLGAFTLKGRVRGTRFTLEIQGDAGSCTSEPLDGSSGSLDLGRVVLEPAKADAKE